MNTSREQDQKDLSEISDDMERLCRTSDSYRAGVEFVREMESIAESINQRFDEFDTMATSLADLADVSQRMLARIETLEDQVTQLLNERRSGHEQS